MFVTFLEFIHVCHSGGQFAQPFCNTTEKCNHYYDHRSTWWFCNFKISCYGKIIHSLTQECTKPKGQKLTHDSHPQTHVEDQTYTYTTEDFHLEFEVLLLGTLWPSSTEPTIEAFLPLHPHGLNEFGFSKHSWSLLPFYSGFTSFAQYGGGGWGEELEPIPKVILKYFFYLMHNFESKNCLLLRLPTLH